MNEAPAKIWFSRSRNLAFVRLRGKASVETARLLGQFAESMLKGGCRHFLFDLTQCAALDTSILRLLVAIGMKVHMIKPSGDVYIMNINTISRQVLIGLGLDKLFAIFDLAEVPSVSGSN